MPVVVTGASGFVGQHAVAAFVRVSPEVRAYVRRREAVEPLRALGAKVAIGWITDVDNLVTVMDGVHTVCHLVGGLDLPDEQAYEEANVAATRSVVRAAQLAGIDRLLFVSYPGASPDASNAFLRSKGEAESLVAAAGIEHVIVRATHAYGRGSPWLATVRDLATRFPSRVVGPGTQVLAPVFVEDLAAVLAAADDREHAPSGVRGLDGPDRITADQLCDLLAGRRRARVHIAPGTEGSLHRLLGSRVSRTALEVLAGDSVADQPDAAAEFGVSRTPLSEGLGRSGVSLSAPSPSDGRAPTPG